MKQLTHNGTITINNIHEAIKAHPYYQGFNRNFHVLDFQDEVIILINGAFAGYRYGVAQKGSCKGTNDFSELLLLLLEHCVFLNAPTF